MTAERCVEVKGGGVGMLTPDTHHTRIIPRGHEKKTESKYI